jgi:tetratricopeptide (TPR) repeat protein
MTAISASAGRTTAAQDVKILEMLEGTCAVYRGLIAEGRIDLLDDLAHAARSLSDFHNRRGDFQAAVEVTTQITEQVISNATTSPDLLLGRYSSAREAAVSLDAAGRPLEALTILDRATNELGAALQSAPPDDPAWVELNKLQFLMLTDRGIALSLADEPADALAAFEVAFSFEADCKSNRLAQELVEPRLRAHALVQRANVLDRTGLGHRAVEDYLSAIALLEATGRSQTVAEELESAKLNLGVTLIGLGDAARAIPLLEAVVAARAEKVAARADDADRFGQSRPVDGDWEPRHRFAFAQYTLATALDRAGRSEAAKQSALRAHDIWKQLVEEEGHTQLGQYQYHSMMQIGMIGLDDED